MARTVYHKTARTGGGGDALDGINGALLLNNDPAFVMEGGIVYEYLLNSTSGATEASPYVISPDANAGTKRWILQTIDSRSIPQLDMQTNPKAFSQAVNMTAAASGSSGITVADNDNIDFGAGNFTLVWRGLISDYTPSADVILAQKTDATNGWLLQVDTTGVIQLLLNADAARSSTAAPSITDGTAHEITCVVTRETASAAGSVVFYVDGVALGSSVAITAGAPTTVNNAVALYVMGTSAVRSAGQCFFFAPFNRALTAAEVLDLYRNGIAYADKWGSQTSIITGNDSTFAGASNWANVDINAYDETGDLTITASAAAQYCTLPIANATMVSGKKYRLVYDVANLVSTWTIKDFGGTQTIDAIDAEGTGQGIEFTASTTGGLRIVAVGDTSSADIDNVYLYEIGATLALEPEGIKIPKWFDSSTNALDASYPAAGS